MALTTYFKADNITALNLAASWTASPAGPPPAATTSQARWDSTVTVNRSAPLGASTTWGQIVVINPNGICTIAATTGTTLTLTPTDAVAAGVGINMAAATQNFQIFQPVVLGSTQEWKVAASRTLVVSGIVSGAFSLSKTDPGNLNLSAVNTFGGAGQTFVVTAGQVGASNASGLGSSLNTISVSSGANLTVSAAIAQTALTVSGAGFTGGTGYGAFTTTNALTSSQVITLGASDTVLTINASTFAAQIAGLVSSFTLNLQQNTTFSTASSYTASGGVRIQSLATNGTTPGTARYSFGTGTTASDTGAAGNGLGNASNPVIVETTGCLQYNPATLGTLTASRNYTFLTNDATPTTASAAIPGAQALFDFAGSVTLTGSAPNQAVYIFGGNLIGNPRNMYRFLNTLAGNANLWVGYGPFTTTTSQCSIGFGPLFSASGWTGKLYTNSVAYYGTTGAQLASVPLVAQTVPSASIFYFTAHSDSAANHPSYSTATTGNTFVLNNAGATPTTATGNLTLGGGPWTSSPQTWQVDAGTLTLNFSFSGTSGGFTKSGASTLVLSGNNTAFSSVSLFSGVLTLNSNGAAGSAAATFATISSGTLDSTTGATLTQNGTNSLNSNFTWGGSAGLTFGSGALSWNSPRTLAFLNGKTGTLKFQGNIGPLIATLTLAVGGAPAGGSRSRLWFAGTNGMLATTSTVTTGYFRVSNTSGLGNAATTLWTVSSGAALEVDGSISPPSTRNCNITGPGPNSDGALRSVSGTNTWNGGILPPVQSLASPTRIQVDAGTFTLAAGTYTTIAPTVSGTPLQFTALGATAVLNQPRQLTANVSDVTVNNGGTGKVVFSVANSHAGTMTCSAGTTKVTDINATSTGNVTVSAGATLESTVQSQFQSTLSLGTLSSLSRATLKFAA